MTGKGNLIERYPWRLISITHLCFSWPFGNTRTILATLHKVYSFMVNGKTVSGALLFNVIENPVLELPLLWEKNGGDQLR